MRALWIVGIVLAFSACQAIQPVFAQSRAGDRIALVIGNAQYPDSDTALTTPVADARAVAAVLQQKGYAVDVGENMAKVALQGALGRFYDKLKAGSTALLYFSGYGIQSNKQNYLIPVDAQIWTEPDLRRDGFNVEGILSEMQKRGADLKVVILDAANRNPFERRFRSFANGLAATAEAPPNALVFYSTQPGQMLRQATGARSPFAEELVRQLGQSDGISRAVFDRTRSALAAGQGGQPPWIYSSLREGALAKDAPPPKDLSAKDLSAKDHSPKDFPAKDFPAKDFPAKDFPAKEGQTPKESPTWVDPQQAGRRPPREEAPPGPVAGRPPETPREPQADPSAEFAAARKAGTREAMERFADKFQGTAWGERGRAELKRFEEQAKVAAPKVPQTPLPYTREDERLRAELNKALERNPADGSALYRRGQLYAIHREYALALADFDEVIRLNPQDVEALNNRCWVRAMVDELDRALRDCNEALKLRPNFPDALDSRGLVNLKIGLPGLAIRDYDAALKGNGKQASSLYGRGMARVRTGETEEGKSDINDALRMDPGLEREFAQYGIR